MPADVEFPPRGTGGSGVDVRFEQAFLAPHRPGGDPAKGLVDDRIAGIDPLLLVREKLIAERHVLGDIRRRQRRRAADHPATTLARDMLHRCQPGVAVVPGRCAEDVDILGIEREPGERHVIFPADQRADAADRGVDHPKPRCVAKAPDHALGIGRHQLAVVVGNAAVGVDDGTGIEQGRTADPTVTLVVADHQHDTMFRRRLLQRLEPTVQAVDGIGLEPLEQRVGLAHPGPWGQAPDKGGLAGKPGLGEDHELGALGGGIGNQAQGALHGSFEIEVDRRFLNDADFHRCSLPWGVLCAGERRHELRWDGMAGPDYDQRAKTDAERSPQRSRATAYAGGADHAPMTP